MAFSKVLWCNHRRHLLKYVPTYIVQRHTQQRRKPPETIYNTELKGKEILHDPRNNKGMAFSLRERQLLRIHGLLPPAFHSQEQQVEVCKISVMKYKHPLNQYLYLSDLHDHSEKLFFRLLSENVKMLMPIVYTPTVGLACQKFGLIYRNFRGLFVTIHDRGYVYNVVKNWPESDVRAVVVTDGERILGLGDLGACGMGIPIGKLSLYTALAGIKPHQCLPVTIDVGTNNKTLLNDKTYVGLRHPRVIGETYDDLIDEFMEAIVKRYGQRTLIQFEDFANHNAFRLLERYRKRYCTFNDDIQGTASVVVAGIMATKRITGKALSENTYLFVGAGGAAVGAADLCVSAMALEGLERNRARDKIWMMDVYGLLARGRAEEELEGAKAAYVKTHHPTKNILEVIKSVRPNVLIGVSGAGRLFTPDVLREMAKIHDRPVIFALSNPTAKAECTAEEAYINTDGRCIFASGSPFDPVVYKDKVYHSGQGNNAYVFPGIALGVITSGIKYISDDVFLMAAECIADHLTKDDIEKGSVYPPLTDIQKLSIKIATKLNEYAYENDLATTYPEPVDKKAFVISQLYNFEFEESIPKKHHWPKEHAEPFK